MYTLYSCKRHHKLNENNKNGFNKSILVNNIKMRFNHDGLTKITVSCPFKLQLLMWNRRLIMIFNYITENGSISLITCKTVFVSDNIPNEEIWF